MIPKKIFRFALVGLLNTLIDFIVFILLINEAKFDPILANVVAFSVSVTNSFFINSRWTFGVKELAVYKIPTLYIGYLLVNSVGVLLSTASIYMLSPFMTAECAKLIGILFTFSWNYTGSKYFIFSKKYDVQ